MTGAPDDDPAIAAAFLARYVADREAGDVGAVEAYQALWPGHEELVGREYAALVLPLAGALPTPPAADEETIGPYNIVRELGRGGQGVVYLAEDPRLRRRVALKVLDEVGTGSEDVLERFRREAEVASRLDHPGICGVLETGVDGRRAWIAMRFIEGETLAATIARARSEEPSSEPSTRDEISEVVGLFERAARALHAAHEAGVVHRDVKPGNLIVTPDGEPVWLDFGLARDGSPDRATLTRTGDVFGTPAYMSPEQLRGDGPRLDRRTDVYSLGVALYERLTLEPPFAAPTREALYRAILEDPVPDARRRNPAVPRDLAIVLLTALERDLDRRYGTALDLAEDLRHVRALEPIFARPAGPLFRATRWVQRNALVSALGAGLVVALSGGLGLTAYLLRESERTREDLSLAKGELEAQLDDVVLGRRSKLERQVQTWIEAGWQDALGPTIGDAVASFDRALELAPRHTVAIVGRTWCASFVGEDPIEVLDRLAGDLRDDPDLLWMRAMILEESGRGAEAAPIYERAGAVETALRMYLEGLRAVDFFTPPTGPDEARRAALHFRRAVVHSTRPQFHHFHSFLMASSLAGETAWMEEAAEGLEFHWPDSARTWDAIAQFFMPIDPERAKQAILRTYDLEPSAVACCGLAQLALTEGDVERAREWYDRGIELEDEFAPTWFLRGELRRRNGDGEGALADYRATLGREPRFPPAYDAIVSLQRERGDIATLRVELLALAEAAPDVPDPLTVLGTILLEAGEVGDACARLAEASARDARDTRTLATWRRALERLDDTEEAARRLEEFVGDHDDSHVAWGELARFRARAGDTEGAAKAYVEALAIQPDDAVLKRELAELSGH